MKLVRDKIPDIIKASGHQFKYHVAEYAELKWRLYEKMREELDEFVNTPCLDEAADMYEVFLHICSLHDYTLEDVVETAKAKNLRRGSFKEGIVLEEVNESR
jgi:predicted house-cleaning noncanonical NTP pyrophosphatase (MazG superfamily)